MEGKDVPDWRDEAAAAVDDWIAAEGRGARKPERKLLGEARPDGDGWYLVDLRGKQVNPDNLDSLQLESAGGDDHHRVMEAVQEGEILRVRVARYVTARGLRLFAMQRSTALLLESLRDSLRKLADAGGCASQLAQKRIDPLPAGSPERAPTGFTQGQEQAFHACLTRGVRLVWGPPGTGKTLVLARAIDRLLERGRRVLLVSGTNVAVDNALLAVTRLRTRPPGSLVRVGPPHIPEVAADESVSLPRLVAARSGALEQERRQVEDRLVELGSESHRLNELDDALTAFDHRAYATARARLEAEGRIRELARRVHERATAMSEAAAARDDAARAVRDAEGRWEAVATARAALDAAAELRRELDDLQVDVHRAGSARLSIELRRDAMREHLADAESARGLARLRNRGEARRLREEVRRLDAHVGRAELAVEAARGRAEDQRRLLDPRIAGHEREAAPLDAAAVESRRLALEAARQHARETTQLAEEETGRVEAARRELLDAEAQPRATDEERRLVVEADAAGWPQLHTEREELRARQLARTPEMRALDRRHEELVQQLERLARDSEREIIGQARLVATTLARFRLHPALNATPYDTVLVDEVGAATLVDVLVPVAAASQTAVLLGDFLQLGPVLKDEVRDSPNPLLQRWVGSTCFDHCDIRTPAEAKERPGCVVLEAQYRFGPDVMELANLAMYAGTLRPGSQKPRPALEHEVVLIDTDGLGEMGHARPGPQGKSRWWPAGSLLAPVLAQHHAGRGERVGMIAPYRPQAEAMLEALHDAEGVSTRPTTEAGTAHGFQGREFDVVVFDTVEDGLWPGWLADRRPERVASGSRVLNVGITRCRTRLYLIGSAELIRSASSPPRTALTPVRELLLAGRIHVVKATDLLQVPEADTPAAQDPVLEELAETLACYVRVVGIHDEHTFYAELHRHLSEARHSVWIWAPWTMKRTEELLAPLRAARERGCRVVVFVLTDQDGNMDTSVAQRELARLREAATTVVQMQRMHQKIVVVDDRIVMYGSLNTLSSSHRREIMVINQGAYFAAKLLDHEHAKLFAEPHNCGRCGEPAALRRSESGRGGYPWFWRCARRCGWEEPIRFQEERRRRSGGAWS
jgi:AAA domain/PLD-like domain